MTITTGVIPGTSSGSGRLSTQGSARPPLLLAGKGMVCSESKW